jgi:nucleoside-diphosphate kinase
MIERSLVLMKPDAVQRGIVGDILTRFESMGLKIVGAKLIRVDSDFGAKHYNHTDEWAVKTGQKNIEECAEFDLDPKDVFGTEDPKEIGKTIDKWSAAFISSGPVLALVFEGPNAVQRIRDHVGNLFPFISPPGTIRGDYGLDSSTTTMRRRRVTYNLIHASGEIDEAKDEIKLWFKDEELLDYRRIHEDLYNY